MNTTASTEQQGPQVAMQRDSVIAPSTVAKLVRLFEQAPSLEQVLLFGSRARGDFRKESDIDLAVDGPDMS